MINVANEWNPLQEKLKNMVVKAGLFSEAINLCLEMHAKLHAAEMSGSNLKTYEDEVWLGLDSRAFSTMPTVKDVTIAWDIWHVTRIEDLVSNILIADQSQVLDGVWQKKLNTRVTDTGNAMADEEIIALSVELDMDDLRNYRIAVGRRTRDILKALKPGDMKRKMKETGLQRIMSEGGLLDVEGSRELLDFWGRKTVAGLILMPITRHQVVHLNDALKLKKRLMKSKA